MILKLANQFQRDPHYLEWEVEEGNGKRELKIGEK